MAEKSHATYPASHSLVQNLRQQLMQGLPFSKMAQKDVDFFLTASSEAYFAPKEVILSPADGAPQFLYLIRQGRVSGRRDIPGIEETASVINCLAKAFRWYLAVGERVRAGPNLTVLSSNCLTSFWTVGYQQASGLFGLSV